MFRAERADRTEHPGPDTVRHRQSDRDLRRRVGGGSGTLAFNGQTYPFQLIGSVIGPGGADRITASGEVYKLSNINDFAGRYTQGSGAAGLSKGGEGQLWLQNNAGVIMHLYSTSSGVLLSLGKEEIIIRLGG